MVSKMGRDHGISGADRSDLTNGLRSVRNSSNRYVESMNAEGWELGMIPYKEYLSLPGIPELF